LITLKKLDNYAKEISKPLKVQMKELGETYKIISAHKEAILNSIDSNRKKQTEARNKFSGLVLNYRKATFFPYQCQGLDRVAKAAKSLFKSSSNGVLQWMNRLSYGTATNTEDPVSVMCTYKTWEKDLILSNSYGVNLVDKTFDKIKIDENDKEVAEEMQKKLSTYAELKRPILIDPVKIKTESAARLKRSLEILCNSYSTNFKVCKEGITKYFDKWKKK